MLYRIGDKVAAPVCKTVFNRKPTRSCYSYDIGTIIATGRNKKTGKPAVKVRFERTGSEWVKRITQEPFYERWCYMRDVDRV